jgi:hypothetical protein
MSDNLPQSGGHAAIADTNKRAAKYNRPASAFICFILQQHRFRGSTVTIRFLRNSGWEKKNSCQTM